jgi:hypothetical protein
VRSGSASQFGANGIVDPGEGPPRAMIDYINAHGGMAGRKVVPVFDEYDTTTSTFAAEAQAACSKFTEDEPVFAVAGWGYDREVMLGCLAAKRTPLVKESLILYDSDFYRRYRGYLYVPGGMSGDRLSVWVDQLVAAKFLGPSNRIGLVRFDTPEHGRAAANVIRPRLAAAGLKLVDEVAIKNFDSAAALADVGAATQNAVLKFNSERIDRVLLLDTGSPLTLFFTTNAESQQYRPRYGLNTLNNVSFVIENVPARQFEGSLGVGWQPAADAFYVNRANAATALCLDIMRDAGVPAASSGDALSNQLRFCSQLFFLKAALDRAAVLTPEGLLAAVEQLGDSYLSGISLATRLGPGRYDGASAVRLFTLDTNCGCFRYITGDLPAP